MEEIPQKKIEYPFVPEGREYKYVSENNPFMAAAKEFARENSLDRVMPTASVLVVEGRVVGRGANGSSYHETHECERVKRNIPTGQGYELCEGCHPKNHSEPKAIKEAQEHGSDTRGGVIYLWGHWWTCQWCWQAMEEAGITEIFLEEGSEVKYNKNNPNNIVGHQFE